MKNSKVKRIGRYEVNDVDVEEEELETEWIEMEHDSAETAELDDEADLLEEDAESAPADDGEFDTVAHYFRESARHKLLPPDRERELTESVKRGRIARKRLDTSRTLNT